MTEPYHYVGSELDLFDRAHVWKAYVRRQLGPSLHGHVLEVGAGLGAVTVALYDDRCHSWTCLEPDSGLAQLLEDRASRELTGASVRVQVGTTADLRADQRFDTILYFDVLEHILEDRQELERVAPYLLSGGHLIVLAPAHQSLYSEFDRAIGHHRRYSRASLVEVGPTELQLVRTWYLDAVGMLASASNRYLSRSSTPTAGQLALWDKVMVRCSRVLDRVSGYRIGRSIIAVWRRP